MIHPLLTTLIATLASTAVAQTSTSVPRLVVGIMVDQLRTDYLEAFSPLYGEDGLKRLMREGVVYANAQYASADVDRASSAASVYTGTVPYSHGIVGEDWMDRQSMRPVHCVDDYAAAGVGTQETSSPKNLLVSTIGDELKLATNGQAIVYGIAPYREMAVLSAGHAADWAAWIDDHTGNWGGSSYYGAAPSWFKFMDSQSIAKAAGQTWKPFNAAAATYNYYLSTAQKADFNHKFSGTQQFKSFKNSALINSVVSQTAAMVVNQSGMGRDDVPDLLALSYYAGTFDGLPFSQSSAELQDTYVRLDAAIADLLTNLERSVGLRNVLLFLTSTGYEHADREDVEAYRIPSNTFPINRCSALLNMYLVAIYGQGQFVESYFGNQLYLNHKLIEQKQLNLADVLETCEDFLFQYNGIRDVYTFTRLTQGAWTPGVSQIRNSYHAKCSGDILIQVNPGWTLINEDLGQERFVRDSYFEFPLIFFGFDLKPETIATPVTMDCIAPTVAHFMRIRAPNACSSAPLPDMHR